MESYGFLYLSGFLFLLVLAILWFFLPFAIFGIQPKIDKLLDESKRTNELLDAIRAALGTIAAASPGAWVDGRSIKCARCGKQHNAGSAACPFCGFTHA